MSDLIITIIKLIGDIILLVMSILLLLGKLQWKK